MASQQIKIDMLFNANTAQAKKNIESLANTLHKIQTTPANYDLDGDIQKASKAAMELQQHLSKAFDQDTGNINLSKFATSLKSSGQNLEYFRKNLTAMGGEGIEAFNQLADSIAMADTRSLSLSGKLENLVTTLKNTARWQISSSLLTGLTSAVSGAYRYAQDLNRSLNDIRIVTGQSADQMAKFAQEANKAAQQLSTTTNEYAKASLIYYQQGLSDTEVKERTDVTVKMANVSRQSAETVSDQMTAVWNNFADGSKTLEYYADVMTALGAATASSTEEISTGLEKFSAVAETVGLSYEYATAALATVTATTRQSADVVGTAFKTLFSRIQDLELGNKLDDGTTLGQYSEALAKVGINIKDTSGQMKDMNAILDEMGSKWRTLSKDTQVALAQNVAGTRQYTQLVALMDNWDFFKENLGTAQNAEGTLQKQADIYAESWEAARDRVTAAAEDIYGKLINDKFFINLTDTFAKLINGISSVVDGLGGMRGILLSIGSIVLKNYAKEIPGVLTNIKNSILQLTNQSEKLKQNLLGDTIKNQREQQTKTTKASDRLSIEGNILTNKKQLELSLKRNQYSKEEYELLQSNLQTEKELWQNIAKQAKEYENVKQNHATLLAQIKEEKAIKNQEEINDTKNKIGEINEDINNKNIKIAQLQEEITKLKGQKKKSSDKTAERNNLIKETEELQKQKTALEQKVQALNKEKESTKQAEQALKKYSDAVYLSTRYNSETRTAINEVIQEYQKQKTIIEQSSDSDEAKGQKIQALNEKMGEFINTLKSADPELEDFNADLSNDRPIEVQIQGLQKVTAKAKEYEEQLEETRNAALEFNSSEDVIKVGKSATEKGQEGTVTTLNSVNAYKRAVKGVPEANKKLSESIGQTVSGLGQLASTFVSIQSVMQVFGDETATTGEKVTTALTSLVMVIPSITSGFNSLWTAAGPWGIAIALAIAGITAAIVKLIERKKELEENDLAHQAERANDSIKELNKSIQSTTSAIEELSTAWDSLNSEREKLNNLVQGTDEWREQLQKVNNLVYELTEKYPELLQYLTWDNNGVASIDEKGYKEYQEQQQRSLEKQQVALGYSRSRVNELGTSQYFDAQKKAEEYYNKNGIAVYDGYGLLEGKNGAIEKLNMNLGALLIPSIYDAMAEWVSGGEGGGFTYELFGRESFNLKQYEEIADAISRGAITLESTANDVLAAMQGTDIDTEAEARGALLIAQEMIKNFQASQSNVEKAQSEEEKRQKEENDKELRKQTAGQALALTNRPNGYNNNRGAMIDVVASKIGETEFTKAEKARNANTWRDLNKFEILAMMKELGIDTSNIDKRQDITYSNGTITFNGGEGSYNLETLGGMAYSTEIENLINNEWAGILNKIEEMTADEARIFAARESGDYNNLTGAEANEMYKLVYNRNTREYEYGNELTVEAEKYIENIKSVIEETGLSLEDGLGKKLFDNFSAIDINKLLEQYIKQAKKYGKDFADALFSIMPDDIEASTFNDLIDSAFADGKVSIEELQELFKDFDIKDDTWEGLREELEAVGLNTDNALDKFQALNGTLKDLKKTIEDLKFGDIITQDTLDKLVAVDDRFQSLVRINSIDKDGNITYKFVGTQEDLENVDSDKSGLQMLLDAFSDATNNNGGDITPYAEIKVIESTEIDNDENAVNTFKISQEDRKILLSLGINNIEDLITNEIIKDRDDLKEQVSNQFTNNNGLQTIEAAFSSQDIGAQQIDELVNYFEKSNLFTEEVIKEIADKAEQAKNDIVNGNNEIINSLTSVTKTIDKSSPAAKKLTKSLADIIPEETAQDFRYLDEEFQAAIQEFPEYSSAIEDAYAKILEAETEAEKIEAIKNAQNVLNTARAYKVLGENAETASNALQRLDEDEAITEQERTNAYLELADAFNLSTDQVVSKLDIIRGALAGEETQVRSLAELIASEMVGALNITGQRLNDLFDETSEGIALTEMQWKEYGNALADTGLWEIKNIELIDKIPIFGRDWDTDSQIVVGYQEVPRWEQRLVYTGGKHIANTFRNAPGGSGGGSNSPSPAEKRDLTDSNKEKERYREIDDALEDNQQARDRNKRRADRLAGVNKIAANDNQIDLLQKEMELNKQKFDEARDYLKKDTAALDAAAGKLGIKIQLDTDGDILNWTDIQDKYFAKINEMEEHYNSLGTKEAQDKYMESTLQPTKDAWEKLVAAKEQFYDTKGLMENLKEENEEIYNEIQDIFSENIEMKLELGLSISKRDYELMQAQIQNLQDKAGKIVDYLNGSIKAESDKILKDAAVYTAYMKEAQNSYEQGLISESEYYAKMEKLNEQAYQSQTEIYEQVKNIQNAWTQIYEKVDELFNKYYEAYDKLANIYDKMANLSELLGKGALAQRAVAEKQAQNSFNRYSSAAQMLAQYTGPEGEVETKRAKLVQAGIWEAYQNGITEFDDVVKNKIVKDYEEALSMAREYQDEMISSVGEYIENLNDVLTYGIEGWTEMFSKDITNGFAGGLDGLQQKFEDLGKIQDEYLTKHNQMYETDKLMNELQQQIDNTSNVAAKQRLKNLGNMIQEAKEQNKLSQLDLDILKARMEVEKAKIALEEAQNAKSVVRLQRDQEGNYGYVYTADQNNVAKAEQDLANTQNDLYNLVLENTNKYAQLVLEGEQEIADKVMEIRNDTSLDFEERLAKEEEYRKNHDELMLTYAQNYYTAAGILDDEFNNAKEEAYMTVSGHIEDILNNRQKEESTLLTLSMSEYQQWQNGVNQTIDGVDGKLDLYGAKLGSISELVNQYVDPQVESYKAVKDEISNMAAAMYGSSEDTASYAIDQLHNRITNTSTGLIVDFNTLTTSIKGKEGAIASLNELQEACKKLSGSGPEDTTSPLGKIAEASKNVAKQVKGITENIGSMFEEANESDAEWTKMLENIESAREKWQTVQDTTNQILTDLAGIEIAPITTKEFEVRFTNYDGLTSQLDDIKDTTISPKKFNMEFNYAEITSALTHVRSLSDIPDREFTVTEIHKTVEANNTSIASPKSSPTKNYYTVDKNNAISKINYNGKEYNFVEKGEQDGETVYKLTGSPIPASFGPTTSMSELEKMQLVKSLNLVALKSGGYTGEWGNEGKLAVLHEKELVLNEEDTANILKAIELNARMFGLGYGNISPATYSGEPNALQQQVQINAQFPSVTDHTEIEMAINNLVNQASQYANR